MYWPTKALTLQKNGVKRGKINDTGLMRKNALSANKNGTTIFFLPVFIFPLCTLYFYVMYMYVVWEFLYFFREFTEIRRLVKKGCGNGYCIILQMPTTKLMLHLSKKKIPWLLWNGSKNQHAGLRVYVIYRIIACLIDSTVIVLWSLL